MCVCFKERNKEESFFGYHGRGSGKTNVLVGRKPRESRQDFVQETGGFVVLRALDRWVCQIKSRQATRAGQQRERIRRRVLFLPSLSLIVFRGRLPFYLASPA